MEKKLTKFDALRTLGNAYWHTADGATKDILHDKFGYIRRSLSIADMAPQVCNEGYNGRMPTNF